MGVREHAEGKRDLHLIDPRKLNVDPEYNVRKLDTPDAREGLDELKALIRISGVQEALRVREGEAGNLIIVRGHRRHKVVMELISEGHAIKTVPVIAEPRGTTPAERNWDLIDSNSAAPLPAVERAEVLYRQIHTFGWSEEEILRRTGKTKQWLNQQLDLRAMPEPVKDQVREGDISATEARKLVKNLPKGTDPVKAAELIKANQEENRRLGVGKGKRHKVTAKTLKRDNPKPAEAPKRESSSAPAMEPIMAKNAEVEPPAQRDDPPPAATTPAPEVHEQLQAAAAREAAPLVRTLTDEEKTARAQALDDAKAREEQERRDREWKNAAPPTKADDFDREMFSIICRLATIGEEKCIGERADDEEIAVPVEVIRAADRAYRSKIGDVS